MPRLTTRRLMLVVAVVAILLGGFGWGEARRSTFTRIARKHDIKLKQELLSVDRPEPDRAGHSSPPAPLSPQAEYHLLMREKYEQAACYPWLPVEPDPLVPE